MFDFLTRRRAVRAAAEITAYDLVIERGAAGACNEVRRRLRWLDADDHEYERELVEVQRAIERLTGYGNRTVEISRLVEG